MASLVSSLKDKYEKNPGKVFCKFIAGNVDEEITYQSLLEKSAMYAVHFKMRNVTKGSPVLIVLKHSPHLFYSFIGAMMVGAIPSILPFPSEKQDLLLYRASLEKLAARIQAKSIITYKENIQEIRAITNNLNIDIVASDDMAGKAAPFWGEDNGTDGFAFLQHSSGTTGLQKGVALTHAAVLNQIENYSAAIKLDNSDKIVSWLPLYHDMGLIACFMMPLVKGVPIIMMDTFEWVNKPQILFEHIEKNKATLCWLPNFAFNFLANCVDTETNKYNLKGMKAFIDCSEACKLHSFDVFCDSFKAYGIRREMLQTCYAMAENVFGISQSEIGRVVQVDYVLRIPFIEECHAIKVEAGSDCLCFLSCGSAIPNTEVSISDDNRNELSERHVGEVRIRSTSLFSGYFRLPDETARVLEHGWFYTGDLGYIAEGQLYITGRKKDLIIVNGKNYYAHDVEFIVNHVQGIKKGRAVAVGIHNSKIGTEEVVLICETTISPGLHRNLIREIKRRISEGLNLSVKDVYLVPLKWIVKTTSGKISRNENKKKYLKEKFGADAEN